MSKFSGSIPKITPPSLMKLEVYKGRWGLPSFDVHCLQILAYAKFSEAPLQVYVIEEFGNSTTGKFPYFSDEDRSFTDSTKIISYLKTLKFNTDLNLSVKQRIQLKAYTQLIKEELHPGLLYSWWLDDINYNKVTWESYSSNLSWPRKLYYPWSYKRDVQRLLKNKYGSHAERSLASAMKCLNTLSIHLGAQKFFLGGSPTSLDAVVFAHLAPLLKAPLPSAALQMQLKKCINLVKFVERVIKEYFPGDIKVEGLKIPREEVDPFPNRRRHQVKTRGNFDRRGRQFRKTTGSSPDLPIIGSLVYCESEALEHAATEFTVQGIARHFHNLTTIYLIKTATRKELTEPTQVRAVTTRGRGHTIIYRNSSLHKLVALTQRDTRTCACVEGLLSVEQKICATTSYYPFG
uniref:Metaxin n=1 Tax=Timema tahoe TaxID=61484 RepID=A0A7R9NYQ5_9NEOP|nr:unnamed protein product [Timema tahoe]